MSRTFPSWAPMKEACLTFHFPLVKQSTWRRNIRDGRGEQGFPSPSIHHTVRFIQFEFFKCCQNTICHLPYSFVNLIFLHFRPHRSHIDKVRNEPDHDRPQLSRHIQDHSSDESGIQNFGYTLESRRVISQTTAHQEKVLSWGLVLTCSLYLLFLERHQKNFAILFRVCWRLLHN